MNINELEQLITESQKTHSCNSYKSILAEDVSRIAKEFPVAILELITAYREAVAALDINTKLFDQYDSCHKLSITEPARKRARDALATAKRLGVE